MALTNVTGTTQTIASNTGYIANNASLVTFTLPSSPTIGDWMMVVGAGAGGWKIAQNASQVIYFNVGGNTAGVNKTTAGTGGHIDSTDKYDCVEIVYTNTNEFNIVGCKGSISIT